MSLTEEDLVYRLRKRAEIRRQIPSRKSVQEGTPDRIADILDEAADEIAKLRTQVEHLDNHVDQLKRDISDMSWIINPDRMGQ